MPHHERMFYVAGSPGQRCIISTRRQSQLHTPGFGGVNVTSGQRITAVVHSFVSDSIDSGAEPQVLRFMAVRRADTASGIGVTSAAIRCVVRQGRPTFRLAGSSQSCDATGNG